MGISSRKKSLNDCFSCMLKSNTLLQARPGKKHIVVKDKQGGFDFITETLEKELVSQP